MTGRWLSPHPCLPPQEGKEKDMEKKIANAERINENRFLLAGEN
jgi:hypothetical protein